MAEAKVESEEKEGDVGVRRKVPPSEAPYVRLDELCCGMCVFMVWAVVCERTGYVGVRENSEGDFWA